MLVEKDVVFKNLNLVIIDEQHRFSVQQRLSLVEKGFAPHTLIMSATPIPRSLTLAFFGNVSIFRLQARPKPFVVQTQVKPAAQLPAIYASILESIAKKERVFWVCPLVLPSEKLPLASATERLETLRAQFPKNIIEILHGKMSAAEKQELSLIHI